MCLIFCGTWCRRHPLPTPSLSPRPWETSCMLYPCTVPSHWTSWGPDTCTHTCTHTAVSLQCVGVSGSALSPSTHCVFTPAESLAPLCAQLVHPSTALQHDGPHPARLRGLTQWPCFWDTWSEAQAWPVSRAPSGVACVPPAQGSASEIPQAAAPSATPTRTKDTWGWVGPPAPTQT